MATTSPTESDDGQIICFGVLGPLAVAAPDPIPITRHARRRLLAILLLQPGVHLSSEVLIDRFWDGRPPAAARTALQTHVSALRRILPGHPLITESGGYRLDLGGHRLDAVQFEADVRKSYRLARRGHWDGALALADHALGFWRGDPFPELASDDDALPEIVRLGELRLVAEELRAESLLELGHARLAIPSLEAETRRNPLRESVAFLLADAYRQVGAWSHALRALRTNERALAELGLEPAPSARRLEQDVLLHRSTSARDATRVA